ncbi:hypothetical protein KW797_02755 [Candidatus Parcubacteria bacterium]|nr:hypothetical protein [Candidatus Parcubacteria bacterium]
MSEITPFAEMILLLYAESEEEGAPYSAKERFERFVGYITEHLPEQEANEVRSEWERKRKLTNDQFSGELSRVPLPDDDREQIIYLMLCGLAKQELPREWAVFERKLYSLH